MTSDGHRLRESWANALNDTLATFKEQLTSGQSSQWKRVPLPSREGSTGSKGKSRAFPRYEPKDVAIHRKSTKSGDIYRIILDVPGEADVVDLEAWKAILATPELRKEWDPAVESSTLLEMYDPTTRIVKTKFTLGWPANPRDAVMISRTLSDATTVLDISTSLPRSADEPAYLRPAPPYVRSHVNLLAWCIQLLSSAQNQSLVETRSKQGSENGRLRITCFWQHDLKTILNIGGPSALPQELSAMVIGLLETLRKRQLRTTVLTGYGYGVSIERVSFDVGREALTLDYSIIPEDQDVLSGSEMHSLEDLQAMKEQKRLQRTVELTLPSSDGWDIRISIRASSEAMAQLPWVTTASRLPSADNSSKICFQLRHSTLFDDHSVLKVKLLIEYSGVLKGIRVNGLQHAVEDLVDRDLKSFAMSHQLLQDASDVASVSINTNNTSVSAVESDTSTTSSMRKPTLLRTDSGVGVVPRGPAFDKTVLARIRRNYIYFSSLLQEPEAKWKRNTEFRGVSVTQLDSIDPTLVVYKAEATFVGISLWDLYSAVVTPGAQSYWDKLYDDSILLEDVNELSELWHYKTKPAWPVTGRDAVVLKTVYKSPTTVHVFAFSVDDMHLFPSIPPVDPNVIRTQIDLQGWAIEALSPTTTQLTLLEQSDPKGWSGKSTSPQRMISNVAGIGEFAIKCGGPPIVTRLSGAKGTNFKYDHERGVFRVEYEPSSYRQMSPQDNSQPRFHERHNSTDSSQFKFGAQEEERPSSASIECELRCDIDTWAAALDIVIDPPPQSISCLRRHRLSAGGGGLWLTVGHDISFSSDERLLAIVRRAPFTAGKEKGVVMVNGKRINVDVEELPESEVKLLTKQKRVKPIRIPLDQPPVLGAIRRRRVGSAADNDSGSENSDAGSPSTRKAGSPINQTSTPKFSSPLSTFFTNAMEQARSTTQQAVAAFAPPITSETETTFPTGKLPMHFALDCLSAAQGYHRGSFRDNWTLVSDKGVLIHRRTTPEISPSIPLHKGEKVIEGVTAEEVASVIFSYDCRKRWDDRFDSVTVLEEYGGDCHTAFLAGKCNFPFRDRGFYLASLTAREDSHTLADSSNGAQSPSGVSKAIYCISASFNPESASSFSSAKYNSFALPIGRVYIDAWIVETLDPYTAENYAIPSTKCTRLVAFDYAGSIPFAVNTMINAALPRSILAVETYVKSISPFPEMNLPAVGYLLKGDSVEVTEGSWTLRRPNNSRVLLDTKLVSDSKAFFSDILISFSDNSATPLERSVSPHGTPRPAKINLPSRPSSPESARRPRVDSNPTSMSPTRRPRGTSSASTSLPRSPPGALLKSRSRDALRSSSSTFSIGKDLKGYSPPDFIIAEIIVDLRTYPDGYEVKLLSRVDPVGSRSTSRFIPLSRLGKEFSSEGSLPIFHTVHTLPPSPLYTSSSGVETPVRHLIRLMLPTSQYEVPTVDDPLTGETHSAPPKPQWYKDLEEQEKRVFVRVEIMPLSEEKLSKGKKVIWIGDQLATVSSEKDASKSLVWDENLNSGTLSKMHLSGGDDDGVLPKQLSAPLAVADDLYDSESSSEGSSTPDVSPMDQAMVSEREEKSDTNDELLSESPGQLTPAVEKASLEVESNTGFLGFFNSYRYSLPFVRLGPTNTFTSQDDPAERKKTESSSRPSSVSTPHIGRLDSARTIVPSISLCSSTTSQSTMAVVRSAIVPRFSISTLLAATLIAFLLGSLLRSLLSPADFIYVVTDLGDVPDGVTRAPGGGLGAVEPGWREIRRLLELKYIVGGWDFQIAVVRRH